MKLLVCAAAYPPSVGGVQTLSARLAGALARRGHRVRVLARGEAEDSVVDAETAPAVVSRVGWKPMLWPRLAGEIFGDRPEALLLTHRADFLRPALAARRLGIPFAVIVHGNEVYGSPRRAQLIAALSRADAVIAVSRYALGRLKELGLRAARAVAIPNGVSFEAFGPRADGEIVRRNRGLEGKKVILSVGRLQAVKGFDAVIRALPLILREVPETVYMIVGGGPEGIPLWALAKELEVDDRVIFTGEVPLGELGRGEHAYYQACDVFAMPSREDSATGQVEAFGIAHLEAGACGRPVVGGRSGGSSEAVAEGESGLLADPENTEDVAGAIVRILNTPELAASMGEAGRRRAEARRWSEVAGEYETVLQEIAGG
ncbi:MAG: glycosyltransferase family 4 protein [Nitrospinota bacterium]